jgi:hypothetical protein
MNRRSFLKYLAWMSAVAAIGTGGRRRFYVAGARYFAPVNVSRGESVNLHPRIVHGQMALAITTRSGEQLGWVPRALIDQYRAIRRATVDAVNLDTVPWRWYRVAA